MSEQCKQRVTGDGWGRSYLCRNKAKRDGYCTIHHPEYIAKKNAKRREKWERESEARQKSRDEDNAKNEHAEKCVNALEGVKNVSAIPTLLEAVKEWIEDPKDGGNAIRAAYRVSMSDMVPGGDS